MSQPTVKQVHNDAALSGLSIAYMNREYIADQIFPTVRVPKQSDLYYEWQKGAWFRNEAQIRAPGARAARAGMPVTTGTYRCQEMALGHPVPIERINNADNPIRPMEVGATFATQKVMLAKEVEASALITTEANWTSEDAAGGWAHDASTNTFIVDMLTRIESIRKACGFRPNTLVMDSGTFRHLKQNSDVIDRIKYTGTQGAPADVTANTIAQLFELDRVLIGSAIYSDAEEVVAGTDYNAVDLWETNADKGSAWLGFVAPMPELEMPSAGYTFNWPGDESFPTLRRQSTSNPYRNVRYYLEEDRKSYVVECSEYYDMKITATAAAFLWADTIAT